MNNLIEIFGDELLDFVLFDEKKSLNREKILEDVILEEETNNKFEVKFDNFEESIDFGGMNKIGRNELENVRVLISMTSWTEDEDFDVLLNSLDVYNQLNGEYESYQDLVDDIKNKEDFDKFNSETFLSDFNSSQTSFSLPRLFVIITGKGPKKEEYLNKIGKMFGYNNNHQRVKIICPWIETEDYPKVVSSAHLGVSLHYSSSGIDLPMKVSLKITLYIIFLELGVGYDGKWIGNSLQEI